MPATLCQVRLDDPVTERTAPSRCPVAGNRASVPRVEPTDALLTARLAAGDDHALAEVYDRLGPVVYGAALRVLGESRVDEFDGGCFDLLGQSAQISLG